MSGPWHKEVRLGTERRKFRVAGSEREPRSVVTTGYWRGEEEDRSKWWQAGGRRDGGSDGKNEDTKQEPEGRLA